MSRWILTFAALFALSAALLFALPEPAHALSCQQRLITTGDAEYRVRQLCGEPTSRQTSVVERSVVVPIGGGSYQAQSVSVTVERWVYDFGPRRLTQHLVFEDGVLVRVTTGSRGIAR